MIAIHFAICLIFVLKLEPAFCGSCAEAKLCCTGRDSSCVVQKTPINTILEDVNEKPCYCDHACLKLGDCCSDFKSACEVSDCVVSSWGTWSECDSDCGTGMMSRRRTVVRNATNGGKHCPPLVQKRGCLGTNCPLNPRSALKEIAMLLPTVTASRKEKSNEPENVAIDEYSYNPINEDLNDPDNSKEYCVMFEISKAAKACRKDQHFSMMREGERVCVECNDEAMRPSLGYRCTGHGTMDRTTRWTALTSPHCHGKWIRLDLSPKMSRIKCPACPNGSNFLFV